MKRTWTIALFQHEQPDESVWRELERLVARWNAREEPKFENVMQFMWQANFDATTRPQLDRLLAALDALRQTRGAAYHHASRQLLEDEDYAIADFIEILGVGLGTSARPFLLNESSAIGRPQPCPRCGAQDAFSVPQREPYVIDETLLDEPCEDHPRSPAGGWDLVNLPNGHKLFSRRLAALLDEHAVEGYDLIEVLAGTRRRRSKRMFQLGAKRAVPAPCPEHTTIVGRPFCPACGTGYGSLDGFFWIRRDWIGDDEIVARHPNRGALLHVSRRVYEALLAASFAGIHRNAVMRVCDHG